MRPRGADARHPPLAARCPGCPPPATPRSYAAAVVVPAPLTALMSAVALDDASPPRASLAAAAAADAASPHGAAAAAAAAYGAGDTSSSTSATATFRFAQDVPIAPYLLALAAGQLASRELGARSRVWAEPCVVEAAAFEFADTDSFLTAGEAIAGPYVWGRYDLLLLPPSFPYGGMENPCLVRTRRRGPGGGGGRVRRGRGSMCAHRGAMRSRRTPRATAHRAPRPH
jgi:hypothetical protein